MVIQIEFQLDHILKNDIVDKGAILTQISKFWFDSTEDIVPNHLTWLIRHCRSSSARSSFVDALCAASCDMPPLECIVRGYITGSGCHQKTGEVCGKPSEGLIGEAFLKLFIHLVQRLRYHDENISYEKSVEVLEKAYPGRGEELAQKAKGVNTRCI